DDTEQETQISVIDERKILIEILLRMNRLYLFIWRKNTSKTINKEVKIAIAKFYMLYFGFCGNVIFAMFGFLYVCTHDERMRPEMMGHLLQLILYLFPPLGIIPWMTKVEALLKLTNHLPNLKVEKDDDLMKTFKRAKLMADTSCYAAFTTITLFMIFRFFSNSFCEGIERTGDRGFLCGSFIGMWYPFKISFFPVREILVFQAAIIGIYYFLIYMYSIVIVYTLSNWINSRLRYIIEVIKKTSLNRNQDIEVVQKKLRNIIADHQEITV
ncbi:hypothetical protein HHI36_017562, partial [Cryptolaemus montrouzieri]